MDVTKLATGRAMPRWRLPRKQKRESPNISQILSVQREDTMEALPTFADVK